MLPQRAERETMCVDKLFSSGKLEIFDWVGAALSSFYCFCSYRSEFATGLCYIPLALAIYSVDSLLPSLSVFAIFCCIFY